MLPCAVCCFVERINCIENWIRVIYLAKSNMAASIGLMSPPSAFLKPISSEIRRYIVY